MTYLLFSGNHYYPDGGAEDFVSQSKTKDDLYALIRQMGVVDSTWHNILCINTEKVSSISFDEHKGTMHAQCNDDELLYAVFDKKKYLLEINHLASEVRHTVTELPAKQLNLTGD